MLTILTEAGSYIGNTRSGEAPHDPQGRITTGPWSNIAQHKGSAQMPNEKKSKPGHAQNGEAGVLTRVILLSLPLLCFQRAVLSKIRMSLERDKDDYVKAVGNLVSFEMHALMMLLDPTGKLRNRFDDSELKAEIAPILEKLAGGVITLVEVQEAILPPLIKILDEIKNGERPATGR